MNAASSQPPVINATKTSITKSRRQLVEHLNRLVTRQDLGALALLRRGLSRQPGEIPGIYAHVLPFLELPDTATAPPRERVEHIGLLVASLYALWHQGKAQPRSAANVSLGAAFRQLVRATDSASTEQRFVALLKASRDRLPDHLRHAISLLKAKDIPLDWELLFSDLYYWNTAERHTQQRWARDFWQHAWGREQAEGDADNDGDVDSTADADADGHEGEGDDN